MKRGMLIDPWAKTLKEIQVDDGLPAILALLSTPEHGHSVDTIDAVHLPNWNDAIYIDDEALLKLEVSAPADGPVTSTIAAWGLLGYPQPYFGKGLLLGADAEGEDADAQTAFGAVLALLVWLPPEAVLKWIQAQR